MSDWNKLSPKQRNKITELIPSDWLDVKVFLINEDKRAGYEFKNSYQMIRIEATRNGAQVTTTISARVGRVKNEKERI